MKRILMLCLLPLAGCVNTNSPEFAKKSAQACLSYGFKIGTEQMANCRMNLALIQEQENMRRKQNMARAMSNFGDDMQRQADRDAYIQAHQQRQINCTSMRYGNMVNTRCN
ncbi:hypothetical protein D3C87_626190 [compost metagenome]